MPTKEQFIYMRDKDTFVNPRYIVKDAPSATPGKRDVTLADGGTIVAVDPIQILIGTQKG